MPLRPWIVDLALVAATAAVLVWLKPEGSPRSVVAEPAKAPTLRPGATSDPEWNRLPPSDRRLLAPLEPMWKTMTEDQRARWREVAGRIGKDTATERQRVQRRMVDWARLSPEQRADARLHFVEATQRSSARRRQERWRQYLALPPDQRRPARAVTTVQSVSAAWFDRARTRRV